MTDEVLSKKLKEINELIAEKKDREVVDEINKLMIEYPDNPDVGHVFLVCAQKNEAFDAILASGLKIMNLSKGMLRKAEICAILSSAYFYTGHYEEALIHQTKAFVFLCMTADAGIFINEQKAKNLENFSDPKITDYLASLLHQLYSENVPAAAMYGTLLGIIREGKILPHDKDIDLVCNLSDLPEVVTWFENNGYRNAHADIFENLRSYKHKTAGIIVDIFAAEDIGELSKVGFVPKGYRGTDWEYSEIIPKVEFEEYQFKGGLCLVPKNPKQMLCALYGNDWKTPDPDFIPFLEPVGVQDSGLRRFYAGLQILKSWLKGNLKRAEKGAELMHQVDPFDPINLYVRRSLRASRMYWESKSD